MSHLQLLDLLDLSGPFTSDNSKGNDSDTSSASGSDYINNETQLSDSPEQGGRRKRLRESGQTLSDTDSRHEEHKRDAVEGTSPQRHGKRRRRKSHTPLQLRRERLRSPSPLYDWEGFKDITPPSLFEESGNESQSPSSDRPDSASEVDWESFLCEDSEMLPPSNWEAEFLKHQERIMDRSSYKGWIQDKEHFASEDLEDAPWYPYDPEDVLLPDFRSEVHAKSLANGFEEQNTICYGVIHTVRVKVLPQALEPLRVLQSAQANSEILKQQEIYLFKVFCEGDGPTFLLQPPKTADEEMHPADNIAVLNRDASSILSEIAAVCKFEAYSPSKPWALITDGTAIMEKNTYILVDIILYGPQVHCREVGEILTAKKVYLQEPDYWQPGLDYNNPHFLDLSAVRSEAHTTLDPLRSSLLQLDVGSQTELLEEQATTQALLKQKIATAFKNMTRAQNLKRITADIRIRTPLLPYQEKALDFIMQRESGPIAEEYRLWKLKCSNSNALYTHVITGCEKHEKPIETGGGILADEMGLGKTLTMLSAIIGTADEAKAFASNIYSDVHLSAEHAPIPSRATLVVVPSPLLLNEWMQEIKLHCTGFSNITIYHSHGREGNAGVLADSDIVLSTYQTISLESTDKKSPLWQIAWFRVILDEAHIIRRMTTKLFKAMKKLRANFRWCLTGTPVQNSLEDLAALVSFVRCPPLDNLHRFRKHVISPLMKRSENGVENLRQILDSVCLRRTKQLLNLPEAIHEPRLLTFSTREEQQYIHTREKLIKMINQNRLQPKNRKGNLGVFQLQLQLRRLCNHGTFQKLSLEAEEFDPEQAIAHLKMQKEATCEVCSVKITGIHGIEEQRSGSFTTCGHLICTKCVPKMKQALQKIDGRDGCFKCSLCPEIIFGEYLAVEEASSKPSKIGSKHLSAWQYFDKNGWSTKVSAVVGDIEQHKTEGKSIVFSCWTRSLDLIGIFLNSRKIAFVRIDGSHSLGHRKWILENYQKDPAIKILLMTTGTGAIGLNLTVANCVYILEPQWNPMVENQAIARVLRLGQKRNVRVVRYAMKGTVEELELQTQQIRKLEYAKVGWKEDDCI